MKKLFALFGLMLVFTLMPSVAMATPPPSSPSFQHIPARTIKGDYVITFNCMTCVPHNITISSYNRMTGVFSGYGAYALNPAYTWNVSGTVTGTQITMQILYTGIGAGYRVDLTGTIARNGTMSGVADDSNGGHFPWTAARVDMDSDDASEELTF